MVKENAGDGKTKQCLEKCISRKHSITEKEETKRKEDQMTPKRVIRCFGNNVKHDDC